jgi:hypothetical protein
LFYSGRFNSLVLVVDPLRSIGLPLEVTSRLVDCSWKRNLTLTQKTASTTPPLLERLKMGAQVLFYFKRFNSLVLVVETLRSIGLPNEVTSRLVDFSWKRKLTLTQKTTCTTPPLLERLKMGAHVSFYSGRFNSLVLVVDGLRSIGLPLEVTSRLVDCSWKRNLTLTQKPTSTTPPPTCALENGGACFVLFWTF